MIAYERVGGGRVRSADETKESRKRIRGFWFMCDAAPGSLVGRYLARRGLPYLVRHPHIRFRANCSHPSGIYLPAMVALIHDAVGDIAAVHRTYLGPEGAKAAVDPPKASMGSVAGGAIRLDPAGPEMVVGEGMETAASAGFLLQRPAWSAIACGNLAESMVLPAIVEHVIIAVDHDEPGRRAAARAARRWRKEGRRVSSFQPDQPGQDFNALMMQGRGFAHAR